MPNLGNTYVKLRNQQKDAYVFKWTIKNISNLENGAIVRSPWFESRPHKCYVELKFTFEIGIGLKLVLDTARNKLRQYKCNITVYDMNGKLYEAHENSTEYPGFSFGINCSTLPNDIILFCKLITIGIPTSLEVESQTSKESLSSDLRRILELSTSTDAILKVQGHDIQVHKAILSARSPVFENMFLSNMMEASSDVVKIEDVDPNTFGILLKYLYTGILCNDSYDIIFSLYYAADKYEVLELRDICSNVISAHLNRQNAIEVLHLAETHCDDYLFTEVAYFIGFYLKETPEWNNFLAENPALMERIINAYAKKNNTREYEFKYNMAV